MNFLHDKHSRYYCIFIVTLVLLLFLMGIAVIDTQTAATKEMFLTHNNAIATSEQYLYLLENVDFTLFFAIYLLIYSIFTPILSQYFQFGYFFFFLFF